MADTLEKLLVESTDASLALLAAFGLFYCFLGYRLFRWALGLTGFVLAGGVALLASGWLSQGHAIVMGVCLLLGGVCGAMALTFLYRSGVFCLGLLGAALIGAQLFHGRPESWAPWAFVGVAILGGCVAVLMERPAMTLATAAIGAWLLVNSCWLLIERLWLEEGGHTVEEVWVVWGIRAVWFMLSVLGAAFQFSGRRRGRPQTD